MFRISGIQRHQETLVSLAGYFLVFLPLSEVQNQAGVPN